MLDTQEQISQRRSLLQPLMRWEFWRKIPPYLMTLTSCMIGITVWPLLAFHFTIAAIVSLLLSGFLDAIGVVVVKQYNSQSPQEAALDIFCDRIVEFAIILGLYAFDSTNRATPTLFMLGSILLCITSFLVVKVFSEKETDKSFFYSPGLIERTEAFIFFILMIIWPNFFYTLAWIFSLLVFVTALIRLWQFFNFSQLIPVKIKPHEE